MSSNSGRHVQNEKGRIYQLKATIVGSKPVIWRQILVPGGITLADLHKVMQIAFGWTDTHLHEFSVKGISYADKNPEMEMDESEDEARVRLQDIAPKARNSFLYIYDFGDDWQHKITVEKIVDQDERFSGRAVCIDGALSGPQEDCGGIFDYNSMLAILKNPDHPEYEETKERLGDYFDPEECDLEQINKELKRVR